MQQRLPVAHSSASLKPWLDAWHRFECWLAVLAFSFIAVILFADVFGREAFGPLARMLGFDIGATGIYGSQKMAIYALVVGAFVGIGISVSSGSQIVPRVAFGWLPARWSGQIDRLSNLTSGIVLAIVTYYGIEFVLSSKAVGTLVAGLQWPAWQIQAVIPFGFASASIRYLIFAAWPDLAPQRPEFQE